MNTNYQIIDMKNWSRKCEYDYFSKGGCNFNMTFPIDMTKLHDYAKAHVMKVYSLMVSVMIKAVNEIQEFHYGFENNQLVTYDVMHPVFYQLMKDENTKALICEYNEDIDKQVELIEKTKEEHKNDNQYLVQEFVQNNVMISSIPWAESYGASFDLQYGTYVLQPIIVFLKYKVVDGKYIVPVTIYCNHKVNDGYHLCKLANKFQEIINQL